MILYRISTKLDTEVHGKEPYMHANCQLDWSMHLDFITDLQSVQKEEKQRRNRNFGHLCLWK